MFVCCAILLRKLKCWAAYSPRLVGRRDVEAGVHPAVGLQRPLAHAAPGLTRSGKLCEFENCFVYQVTLDRLSEELIGGHDEGAEDEEGGRVSVEQAECPVIY